MEHSNTFPIFYPCANEAEFQSLDTQACELLGYPDAGALDYCNPIVSVENKYYFIVNQEVVSLFTQAQLDVCVPYEDIVIEQK